MSETKCVTRLKRCLMHACVAVVSLLLLFNLSEGERLSGNTSAVSVNLLNPRGRRRKCARLAASRECHGNL